MRQLTHQDARDAILGGGVFSCGGGGWRHHGERLAAIATSIGMPMLATVDELSEDSWVATVTAITASAAPRGIEPLHYLRALQLLMIEAAERHGHRVGAVMTAQNGYSTSVNGWLQSAVLGIPVLDAAADIRAHPTGKLGSLGLSVRPGYESIQAVAGGNRERSSYVECVVRGAVSTCDDVLRDVSVRTGGVIASARNPVEPSWVRANAALGAVSTAIDLGARMRHARFSGAEAVVEMVCGFLGARELTRGAVWREPPRRTHDGFDHGALTVGDVHIPYLNEYMAAHRGADPDAERLATYPDTISVLRLDDGLPLAVEEADENIGVAVIAALAAALPRSTSACDVVALSEVEQLMKLSLVDYLKEDQLNEQGR
jgi:DUF917 family protein